MRSIYNDYAQLLRRHPAPLAFGFLHAFLSSAGQTFFIALFVGSLAQMLEIGAGEIGLIYLAATLASAALLTVIGHWIDRIDLRLFTGVATAGLGIACLLLASAQTVVLAAVALLLLRLTGQGLMMHVEGTAIARYFGTDRGKALSLTGLGLPLAEGVLPILAVALIAVAGWQTSYALIGAAILLVFLPLSQYLLRGQPAFVTPAASSERTRPTFAAGIARVARSRFFWLGLMLFLYMPFAATALLFHIEAVAAAKTWPLELVASAFTGLALLHGLGILMSGRLIDRFTAKRLTPFLLLPIVVSLVFVAASTHWSALFLLMAATGLSSGFSKTALSALWVELFGTVNVGAIRALTATLMVCSTAVGPVALGYAMDAGIAIGTILYALAALGAAATGLALCGLMLDNTDRRLPQETEGGCAPDFTSRRAVRTLDKAG